MFDLLKKKIQGFAEKVKEKAVKKKAAAEEAVSEGLGKAAAVGEKEAGAVAGKSVEEEKAGEAESEKAVEGEKVAGEPLPEKLAEEAVSVPESAREIKPSVSIKGKLKAVVKGTVELEGRDLGSLLWELELALLEADVEQTTAEEISKEIKERLVGKKIGRREDLGGRVKKEIREILQQMMQTAQPDLLKNVRSKKEKPYKILFLGPNGAGKTTTMAKLAFLMRSKGLGVIWAASDTFRAASIEQLEQHAGKLGIKVIKHQYGADPAAVAFDAVKSAQSKGIDCLMIDSAGRQETNRNLMGELQKIVRVVQPDLKLYVGEAFTGQALLQQAKEYEKEVGIDAFILTKIDCDSKGGTTISLLYKLRKPVLFIGTGQEYKDLQRFEPQFVLKRII